MRLSFPDIVQFAFKVGRAPRPAADALVGLLRLDRTESIGERRVQGDPCRPGGLPHKCSPITSIGKTKWHCALLRAAFTCVNGLVLARWDAKRSRPGDCEGKVET